MLALGAGGVNSAAGAGANGHVIRLTGLRRVKALALVDGLDGLRRSDVSSELRTLPGLIPRARGAVFGWSL